MDRWKKLAENTKRKNTWKPFLRQLVIASSGWPLYFCMGMMFGSPTVVIPQFRRANVTITDEMASWLSSTFSYASIPWVFILTILGHIIGRKKISIFIYISTIISNIAFYFSTTTTHLLITECIYGITQAAVTSMSIIVVSEYTSPEYRGIFLCIKSSIFLFGIWLANAIGIFTHWRVIPITSFAVSLFSLNVFYWPESPQWLAGKNKFLECRKAHRWLKGTDENSEKELRKLIQSKIGLGNDKVGIKDYLSRECIMPLSLSLLAVLQYQLSGKFVITIYAIDIMKKIIRDESTVYAGMLILDGVTVFSAFVGSIIAKYVKRRTILIVSSSFAVAFLFILALYLFLVSLFILSENVYVSIFLLAGFSISISCGPMILATSLYGELTPRRFKTVTIILIALEFVLLHGTLIKIAPTVIKTFSLPGTFLFYALSSGFCVFLMYLYLPETKDKTLLDIEEYFSRRIVVGEDETLVS